MGAELEPRKQPQAPVPFSHSIKSKREDFETGLNKSLAFIVPATVSFVSLNPDFAPVLWASIPATILAAGFFVPWRRWLTPVIKEDFRSSDYPRIYYIMQFAPALGAIAATALSGEDGFDLASNLPPVVFYVLFCAVTSFCFTLSFRATETFNYRVGKRRANQILKDNELEGVTAQRIEVAEANQELLSSMVALGAVDNQWVQLDQLAKLLGTTAEDVQEDVVALDKAELIDLRRIGLQKPVEKWTLSVSPQGVRVLNAAGQR